MTNVVFRIPRGTRVCLLPRTRGYVGKKALVLISILLLLLSHLSCATTLVIPPDGDVVGEIEYVNPIAGETLAEVGLRYDIGYYEMVNANPHVDSKRPLSAQARLLIPSQYILPPVSRHGLVINLAEFRLYFFPENDNVVMTYPVGIGRKGWSTPVGLTKVIAKQVNPTWRPTASVLAQAEKNGVQFPDVFPSGPANPLGKYALRLGWPTYLIHGANHTGGIGERVSAGCIRMLPDDIDYLFELVPVGASVRVVNIPVKFGRLYGALYVEIHPPLLSQKNISLDAQFGNYLAHKNMEIALTKKMISLELGQPTGVPQKIATYKK